jgi:hypothetical protein
VSEPSLKDRVLLYNLMQLPGQPQMMHVGSSNLVNDLAAEVTRLTAALALRTPADGWREGAEAMREACAKIAERYILNLMIAAAIRALPIPSPPAEETT